MSTAAGYRPAPTISQVFQADRSAILRSALSHAVMAPSTYNTQPWRFRVGYGHVDVVADRTRSLPVADPRDRELTISCGACLFFLRTAIRHLGWEEETVLLPDPADPDLLARVSLGRRSRPTPEVERLFAAIPNRRTVRTPFLTKDVSHLLLAELQMAAAQEGAVLHLIEGESQRSAVALLVDDAARMQATDPDYRRELAHWVHPNRSAHTDGLAGSVFGLGDAISHAGSAAVRWLDWGAKRGRHDQRLTASAPALAALVTPDDSVTSWLNTGEALGRVLLQAAAHGLMASFLNQPVEVADLRGSLARAAGIAGYPQVVLRLGYPIPPDDTPRRPLTDVMIETQVPAQ